MNRFDLFFRTLDCSPGATSVLQDMGWITREGNTYRVNPTLAELCRSMVQGICSLCESWLNERGYKKVSNAEIDEFMKSVALAANLMYPM